jgi:hypothetical protein
MVMIQNASTQAVAHAIGVTVIVLQSCYLVIPKNETQSSSARLIK